MGTSNAATFRVVPAPALENVGWEVRVLDCNDFTTEVAVVPEFISLSIGPELSASGAGSITLDADMAMWNSTLPNDLPARALLNAEYLWVGYEDGERRFEFLGRNIQQTIVDVNGTATRAIVISGPGSGEVLRFAKILPPGFPKAVPRTPDVDPLVITSQDPFNSAGYTNDVAKMVWQFPMKWPAMRMWWTLFKAAQSRKTIPWVTPHFTATTDSGGAPFEYIPTVATQANAIGFSPEMGKDLLDFLNDCTGQEYSDFFAMRAEWRMLPGFQLYVFKAIGASGTSFQGFGSDVSRQVVFYDAIISQKERTQVREDIANYVVNSDQNGYFSIASDAASVRTWNRRELWKKDTLNVYDVDRRQALADVYLAQHKDEKSEWVIAVPYDQPGRRPFRDYDIGDWVGIAQYDNNTGATTVDKFRVLAITVTVENDFPAVELTLQSRIEYKQHLLEAKLTQIFNKITPDQGTIPAQPVSAPLPGYGTGTSPLSGISVPAYDPSTGTWSNVPIGDVAGRNGNGYKVWIQDTDPGDKAMPGDFWYNTAYTPEPDPAPDLTDPPSDDTSMAEPSTPGTTHIPNTNIYFDIGEDISTHPPGTHVYFLGGS